MSAAPWSPRADAHTARLEEDHDSDHMGARSTERRATSHVTSDINMGEQHVQHVMSNVGEEARAHERHVRAACMHAECVSEGRPDA